MSQTPGRISRTRIRFYTAIVLFIGMVVLLLPPLNTGIAVHEWIGFLILAPLLVHIIVDWKWVLSATRQLFKRQPGRTRFNYFWDWLLFIMITVAIVSGVLISESALPALGITMKVDAFWTGIHVINSRFLLMVLGVHIAMHLRWIVSATKPSLARLPRPGRLEPGTSSPSSASAPRRNVLRPVFAIAIAAALVSLAIMPLADAEWAETFRNEVQASLDAEAQRPSGVVTLLTDLFWIAIIMGIPALITLCILSIAKYLPVRASARHETELEPFSLD